MWLILMPVLLLLDISIGLHEIILLLVIFDGLILLNATHEARIVVLAVGENGCGVDMVIVLLSCCSVVVNGAFIAAILTRLLNECQWLSQVAIRSRRQLNGRDSPRLAHCLSLEDLFGVLALGLLPSIH